MQKLQRLMRNRPPRDVLPKREVAGRRNKPPLHYSGFPFTIEYAVEYARRHALTIQLAEEDYEAFGVKAVFNFADVDDSQLAPGSELRIFIKTTACHLMVKDLAKKCRMVLQTGRPFSLEWDSIVALWSNYDVRERHAVTGWRFDEIVDVLKAGMNEGDGPESKLQWWFDWDNNVVCSP